ncbi:hypothetical protein [Bifidobacterium oedipodis]|uniref:hypothetical protein n=1 Tax=Bifidobacterium oedipodis TaxID=2675322 RepID=UPI003AA86424
MHKYLRKDDLSPMLPVRRCQELVVAVRWRGAIMRRRHFVLQVVDAETCLVASFSC